MYLLSTYNQADFLESTSCKQSRNTSYYRNGKFPELFRGVQSFSASATAKTE